GDPPDGLIVRTAVGPHRGRRAAAAVDLGRQARRHDGGPPPPSAAERTCAGGDSPAAAVAPWPSGCRAGPGLLGFLHAGGVAGRGGKHAHVSAPTALALVGATPGGRDPTTLWCGYCVQILGTTCTSLSPSWCYGFALPGRVARGGSSRWTPLMQTGPHSTCPAGPLGPLGQRERQLTEALGHP